MTATYNNPQSTEKDAVRFLCGDTGPTFDFSDEEIVYLLSTQANVYMAAALLCDKFTTVKSGGGLASKSVGSLSESYSQGAIQFYQEQAKKLRKLGSGHQVPFTAEIAQKFSFRQFDYYGAPSPRLRSDTAPNYIDEELE